MEGNKNFNYEGDVHIDEQALDVECVAQSKLVMKYTRHLAWCERDRDRLKESLKLVESELELDIRLHSEKYGMEKVTDKSVAAIIPTQKSYKDTLENYLNAKFEYSVAKGACDAIDHKKTALELLVKLHGQGYFAGPNIPRDLGAEVKKYQENRKETAALDQKISASIGSKMKRT